jgi:hypothetical protein
MTDATISTISAPMPRLVAMRGWRPTLIVIGFGLAALLVAHGDTVGETVAIWNRTQSYRFAWAVIPTLAYLIWHNRQRLAAFTPTGSLLGVAAAAVSGAIWIMGDLLNFAEVRQFAVVAGISAIVLAAVGRVVFRELLPFLALLVFLVPTGGFLLAGC